MKLGDIEEEVQAAKLKSRFRKVDLLLAAIGEEIGNLFVIGLALAILCSPWAFGLAAAWGASVYTGIATGHPWMGWIAGVIVFTFFCRYVWGSRLQRASRRAAEALIAGR
ncbi:MAG: hypothetical protein JO256_14570 [Alphaproteobacteria bacterium]|nr:hypothetical protein [Alphaproteobacteria bacterium]